MTRHTDFQDPELLAEERDDFERRAAIATAARAADLDELVDALADHKNAPRRNRAMEILACGGKRSVPTLIRALKHSDPDVVLFATNVLGRTRDTSAIPHLLALLRHHENNVVTAAIESLGQLRATPAVEPLIAMLDLTSWFALAAVHALGQIGDGRAVEALVRLSRDELFADFVADALGHIGTAPALAHLARVALEPDGPTSPTVAWNAIGRALEQMPDDGALQELEAWRRLRTAEARKGGVVEQALEAEPARKAMAIEVVRALRLEHLYPRLIELSADERLRDRVEFAILSLGREAESALGEALRSPRGEVRVFACGAAGLLDLQPLASAIEALVHDPHDAVVAAAVQALGRMGRDASLPTLVRLTGSASPAVAEAAVKALSMFDADRVTAALLSAAPTDTPRRVAALRVSTANPHPDQLAFIRACLDDSDPAVRLAAADAVAGSVSPTLRDLVPLLEDPSADVRRRVVTLLGSSRDPEVRRALLRQVDRDAETRERAIRALAAVGDAKVARRLLALVAGATPQVRVALVEALAELSPSLAAPTFARLLCDAEPDVRRAAVHALGRTATAPALRRAAIAAHDPVWFVRAALAEALRGNDAVVQHALERLSVDPHDHVSSIACRRLAETFDPKLAALD